MFLWSIVAFTVLVTGVSLSISLIPLVIGVFVWVGFAPVAIVAFAAVALSLARGCATAHAAFAARILSPSPGEERQTHGTVP